MHLYFRVGLWVGAGTVAAGGEHPETPHAAASTVNSGISGSSTAVHWSSRRLGGRCRTSWSRRRWRYCWTAPATRFWLSARTASDAGQCLLRNYSGPLGTRHMWRYNHRESSHRRHPASTYTTLSQRRHPTSTYTTSPLSRACAPGRDATVTKLLLPPLLTTRNLTTVLLQVWPT